MPLKMRKVQLVTGIGYDSEGWGGIFDPYGSLSTTAFELGGVEYSIVELRVGDIRTPAETGKLFLRFDKPLPDGAEFTLTLGTTEFNSSGAFSYGTYIWEGGPNWSVDAEVAVGLDIATPAAFREGATLEELGAFTTPTMPPTLAFEAEMTVATGTSFDGYDSTQGSLSPGTFDVGGVPYTVDTLGLDTDDNEFELTVTPALPFDSFTLTLGATELSLGSTDYGSDVVLVKNTGQTPIGANVLTSTNNQFAQQFTTGAHAGGYRLGSIGFRFGTIADTSTAGDYLTVTLNADNNGNPGAALCTLRDPASFTSAAVNTFDAPATGTNGCPSLAPSTTYFVVMKQLSFSAAINIGLTPTDGEDSGGAQGRSIGNDFLFFSTTSNRWSTAATGDSMRVEVNGGAALPAPNVSVNGSGSGTYTWSGRTNPSWASGATVDVNLDIGIIDICGRTPTVADAIVAATASFDYCHMTSQLDMDDITELDLTGKSGYDLKAGDFAGLPNLEILNMSGFHLSGHSWNQLPVGLFDGLDNLEVLDLSDTNLLNLNRGIFGGLENLVELDLSDTLLDSTAVPVGVFDGLDSLEILRIANAGYLGRGINFVDEDIFRGLNTLRELDVRPIRPPDDVLAPLTSLETLNGQDYTP